MSRIPPTTWVNAKRVWEETKRTLLTAEKKEFIIYDLETTGLSKTNDVPIEIGAVRIAYNEELDTFTEIDRLHVYIKPPFRLDPKIIEITGITDEFLDENGISEEDAFFDHVQEFFMNDIVAGYNNNSFDNKFMENLYARYGAEWAPAGSVDVMVIAKKILKKPEDVENHKLVTIGKYFGIDFDAHSADEDAKCTLEALKVFISEMKEMESSYRSPSAPLKRPVICSINFWEGYRGFSRIYVDTTAGKMWYDIRGSVWASNDFDINSIDMEFMEPAIWKAAGCNSEKEFSQFKLHLRFNP